jgi:thiamine monophosphate kinase
LHGGEDFELLFSVRARKARQFEAAYPHNLPPASRIGRLTSKRGGVVCMREPGERARPLAERGFDHFVKPQMNGERRG